MPGQKFQIELPLPPRHCSPNGRGHWIHKAKATGYYREECRALLIEAQAPRFIGLVRVLLEFYLARGHGARGPNLGPQYPTRYRPTDPDNAVAACKPLLDSLVQARVIPADSARELGLESPRMYLDPSEHAGRACVVLTVEAL